MKLKKTFLLAIVVFALPLVVNAENIKLTCDDPEVPIEKNYTIGEGDTATIDLNGCLLNGQVVNNGTLTITDSTLTTVNGLSSANGVIYSDNGYTVINNGTMNIKYALMISTSQDYQVISNKGTLTIEDGTFEGFGSIIKNDSGTINIKGGTFSNYLGSEDPAIFYGGESGDKGTLNLTGGIFHSITNVTDNNYSVADGYSIYATEDEDGSSLVVAKTFNSVKFPSGVIAIRKGETLDFKASTDTNSNVNLSYSSEKAYFAKIDVKSGLLTGVSSGITNVKVVAISMEDTAKVVVYDFENSEPKDNKVDNSKLQAFVGEEMTSDMNNAVNDVLKATFENEDTKYLSGDTAGKLENIVNNAGTFKADYDIKEVDASSVSSENKTLLKDAARGANVTNYLDISLNLKSGDENLGNIVSTPKEVKVTLAIPKEMQKENRVFSVIRLHDGKADKLNAELKDDVLTFKTDAFSTYAIAYEEKKAGVLDDVPKTSDIVPYGLLILAIVGGVVLYKKKAPKKLSIKR